MRHRLLLAAFLVTFAACQRRQQDPERDPTAESTAASSPQELAARFEPMMRGVWIRKDYLAALATTQSPYRAAARATDVVVMGISMAPPLGRSVRVAASLNNHEGYDLNLILTPGQTPNSLPTSHFDVEHDADFYELSYETTAADTILRLNRYNRRHKLLDAVEYQRVRRTYAPERPADNVAEVLQHTVRRLLFAGRYQATDSAGRAAPAELTADGQVRGLGTLRRFEPNTDFVVTLANDRDNMSVETANQRRLVMTYRLSNDTLRLYAARIVEQPEPALQPGRLQYTLVRRR